MRADGESAMSSRMPQYRGYVAARSDRTASAWVFPEVNLSVPGSGDASRVLHDRKVVAQKRDSIVPLSPLINAGWWYCWLHDQTSGSETVSWSESTRAAAMTAMSLP